MEVPVDVDFENVAQSDDLKGLIHQNVAGLSKIYDQIIGCYVRVEQERHAKMPVPYRVRVELTIPPGHGLGATEQATSQDEKNTLPELIHKAFDQTKQRLQDRLKHHPPQHLSGKTMMGVITKLMPTGAYGYLRTRENQEIYFQASNVLGDRYNDLTVGTIVRFFMFEGIEGWQASAIHILKRPI
jgi:ribosome-associated translation inhibitor RaiA